MHSVSGVSLTIVNRHNQRMAPFTQHLEHIGTDFAGCGGNRLASRMNRASPKMRLPRRSKFHPTTLEIDGPARLLNRSSFSSRLGQRDMMLRLPSPSGRRRAKRHPSGRITGYLSQPVKHYRHNNRKILSCCALVWTTGTFSRKAPTPPGPVIRIIPRLSP